MKFINILTGISCLFLIPLSGNSQATKPILSTTEKDTVAGGNIVNKQYLSVAEKKKPYAKYFYMPMAPVDPAMIDSVTKGPIDPSRALTYERLNDLLKPGYLKSEIGYCILPDGTGYVSSIVKMPGVTAEMFDWWFTWHQLDPLRYKIWDHYVHYDVYVNDIAKKKLLSKKIPMHEKNWDITHHANEDIGMGAMEIPISFVSPREFGFDMSQFKVPNVSTAICAIGGSKMVHIARSIDGGIELRTRFWFPAQANVPLALLKGLNYHALEEYTNLARILPMLYAEYGQKNSDQNK
jgi:hypothetical protein